MAMAFDMTRFMNVWNAHDVDGIMAQMTDDVVFEPSFGPEPWGAGVDGRPFKVEGCDILTLRDGRICGKRSYRKAQL
jgi:ketosteroid isomerase-like protein